MNSNAIVGFGNARSERDYYPTPPDVTEALIRLLDVKHLLLPCDRIWECACGSGDMAKVFMDHNYSVLATDIATGVDFLKTEKRECDWIITNPPFCLAEDFIRRASDMRVPFAFLLKATYWHSKKRTKLFEDCRPSYILPLTWRPDFTGQGASLLDMMWCVWTGEQETAYQLLERP